MKKKLILALILISFALFLMYGSAFAATIIQSDSCDPNDPSDLTRWTLDSEGILTISGSGPMPDLRSGTSKSSKAAWSKYTYAQSINGIVIEEGITYIGECAFSGLEKATRLSLPSTLTKIGNDAFYEVNGITKIELSDLRSWCSLENISAIARTKPLDLYLNGRLVQDLVIPYGVTNLQDNAFSHFSIKSVTTHNGLETIGANAFYCCTGLVSVHLTSGVKEIGASAFSGCTGLTAVALPDTITQLGSYSFYNCASLQEIKIPIRVSRIENSTFSKCVKLESVTLTPTITQICDYAFKQCSNLKSIDIPVRTTQIGYNAFYECESLKNITLPKSLKKIGGGAFEYCAELESVTFLGSELTLENAAFKNCQKLRQVTLPDGLKSIPADTFNRCYELTDLKLPSALSEIGDHAFAFTDHLESIEFPADLSMIASYAFYCSALKDIRFLGAPPISIANSSFDSVEATVYYSYNSSSWNDENLLSYGGALNWVGFNGTSDEFHIVSGAYDANVTWTFNPYEKALEISGYGDIKGLNGLHVNLYPWGKFAPSVKSVVIKNGVTTIPRNAFYGFTEMTQVTIPRSVSGIGDYAFSGCAKLSGIALPDTIRTIGSYAFLNCKSLRSLEIPKSVIGIGSGACSDCAALSSVTVRNSMTQIPANMFEGCVNLAHADLGDRITVIGDSAFEGCSSLSSLSLGEYLTTICSEAFKGCTLLKDLTLPSSVTLIEYDAFTGNRISLRFNGPAPDLDYNPYTSKYEAFSDAYVTVLFPITESGWTEYVNDISVDGEVVWEHYAPYGTSIKTAEIVLDQISYVYDGSAKRPNLHVSFEGIALKNGTHYTATYLNNVNVGTASVTITGMNGYVDSQTRTFSIGPKDSVLNFAVTSLTKKVNDADFTNQLTYDSDGTVYYSSSNAQVAEVDSAGRVSIHRSGVTTITATVRNCKNYRSATASYTLTVEQQQPTANTISLSGLTYSFTNSRSAFGYPSNYRIPLDRYQVFFTDTKAKALYSASGYWGGNCYGMSSTSSLFNVSGSGIDLSLFGTSSVSNLKPSTYSSALGFDARALIELFQVSQLTSGIQDCFRYNTNLNSVCKAVDQVQYTGKPVIIAIWSATGGHAIVGYKIEKISATTSRMYVYDCNYPKQTRYITLTTDTSGNYTKWYYHSNYGSDYVGSKISYVPYSAYQGILNSSDSAATNTLMINQSDFLIKDYAGNILAEMVDGSFVTESSNIYEYLTVDMDIDSEMTIISLPSDVYEIVSVSAEPLNVSMVNKYQSSSIDTTADSITLSVVDADESNLVYINGSSQGASMYASSLFRNANDTYTITFRSELESAGEIREVTFSGVANGDQVQLGLVDGELQMINCEGVNVTINGESFTQPDDTDTVDPEFNIANFDIVMEYSVCGYDGTPKEPGITISKDGTALENGVDFILNYSNNVEMGKATVAIYGMGQYKGIVFAEFLIKPATPDSCASGHTWSKGTVVEDHDSASGYSIVQKCWVCSQENKAATEKLYYSLVSQSDNTVMVELFNARTSSIDGILIIIVYDSAGNTLNRSIHPVSLSAAGRVRVTVSAPSSEKIAKVKAFTLDERTYAPLDTAWICQ